MNTFYDYNPTSPFAVSNESKVINAKGVIRLNYVPQKGSVTIAGFTEKTDTNVGLTEFYIDYQDSNAYRTAQGLVYFNISQASNTVTVNYNGVSTLIMAEALNEVKAHMEDTTKHLSSAQTTLLTSLANQVDTKTYFVPSGFTYAPPTREDIARTTNQLWVDCCDNTGSAQTPTSFVLTLYKNGTLIYTSPAITTASTVLTVNLSTVAGDLLVWKLSNTTGITGGVSVTRRMVSV